MNTLNKNKSIFNYKSGEGGIDSYGVDHSGFTLRDELEYQMARTQREQELLKSYNANGITNNNLINGTSFWGNSADNNYGFGTTNISQNVENVTNQLKNSGDDRKQDFKMVDFSNQTPTPWIYNTVVQQQTTPTPWEKKRYMSIPLNNGTISVPRYDNHLTALQRIQALKDGEPLNLHIKENPQENGEWKRWCDLEQGSIAVNKYNDIIDKYAHQYNIDPDLVKAIMFAENACGYYYGANKLVDYIGMSKSQLPMNIRGNIWSDFQGKHYDTEIPEQNIELGTRLIKQIYDSIENPTPEKVTTIWNSAPKDKISSFGYRGGTAYRTKPWLKNKGKQDEQY